MCVTTWIIIRMLDHKLIWKQRLHKTRCCHHHQRCRLLISSALIFSMLAGVPLLTSVAQACRSSITQMFQSRVTKIFGGKYSGWNRGCILCGSKWGSLFHSLKRMKQAALFAKLEGVSIAVRMKTSQKERRIIIYGYLIKTDVEALRI